MSIHRLNSFIKENDHDIVDYWIYKQHVHYVRVLSRKLGYLYMIKVEKYHISVEDQFEALKRNHCFYLETSSSESISKKLSKLFDVVSTGFPEYRHRFLLYESNFLMESKDCMFEIANMPTDGLLNFYFCIELEWFYENLFIVNHEMERCTTHLFSKTRKLYEGFVPMYQKLFQNSEKDLRIIEKVWKSFSEHFQQYEKTRKLCLQLTHSENDWAHQLTQLNQFSADNLTFQETVRRTHIRKQLHQKLVKVRGMYDTISKKMIQFHSLQYNFILRYLLFIYEITSLMKQFHCLFLELEALLPSHRLEDFDMASDNDQNILFSMSSAL